MKYDIESIKKRKEISNRIKKIIFIFLVLIIYNIVLLYISCIDKFDTPSFYIYKAYIISTESMQPTINKGDAIIIKKINEDNLEIGDIVTFKIDKEIITHRIVRIESNGKENVYITKGDNNNITDDFVISYKDIEGKKILKIPYLGNIAEGLKNGIIIILVVLIFLIIHLNRLGTKEKSDERREKKKIADKEFTKQNINKK